MEEQGEFSEKQEVESITVSQGSIILDKGTFEVIDVTADELAKLGCENGELTVIDGSQWYKIPSANNVLEVTGVGGEIAFAEADRNDNPQPKEASDQEEKASEPNQEIDFSETYILEGGQVTCIQEDGCPRKGTLVKLDDGTTYFITQDEEDEILTEEAETARPYECKVPGCNRSYRLLHHLKVHANSHLKPYECPIDGCGKSFSTVYSRTAHIRTHTGEKPYTCTFEQCKKGFKTSGDLQKHIRTHTGERPFVCPVDGCNKSFTTSNIRKVHVRTHTGEKPYICDYPDCDKSFASSTNYKNHLRIHSGLKPYCCSVPNCSKKFTEYSSLHKHQLVHTQMKRHPCPLCNKSYRQISTLLTHKRTNHGIITADDGTEIALEHVIGVGEDGSKSFKNIASNLLSLKREKNALLTVEDNGVSFFIVSQLPEEENGDPLAVVKT